MGGKGNVLESPLSTSTNTRTPSTKGSAGSTVRSINRSGVRSQGPDTSPGDADVLEVSTDVVEVRADVIDVIMGQIVPPVILISFYNSYYHVRSPISTSKHLLPTYCFAYQGISRGKRKAGSETLNFNETGRAGRKPRSRSTLLPFVEEENEGASMHH